MALTELLMQPYAYTAMHYVVHGPGEDADTAPDPFILDTPYQRQSVWNDEQRINLVRSLMLGVPIGAVTLNVTGNSARPYAVVDGRQRIETIRSWFADGFASPTDWWTDEELLGSPADYPDGVRYSDLTSLGRMRCKTRWKLPANEARLPADQEPGLYLLVNFSGVAQTDQDRERVEALATRAL